MDEIKIGDKYFDNSKRYTDVIITDKTESSIQFKDTGGFYSWIFIGDFLKGNRFTKTK